jgi:hypothetical protein
METFLFFMLGALLIGVGVLTHVLIKSLSRISQLERDKFEHSFELNKRFDDVYTHISENKRDLHDCDERIINDYSNIFKDVNKQIDKVIDLIHAEIKSMEQGQIRSINDHLDGIIRTTDSRIDKFENKLESNKNEILKLTSSIIDDGIRKELNNINKRLYEFESAQMSRRILKG